ncbi:MAG TPA: HEAT repeat domain-containing protein [Polyangiales bacterium]|nr:HEAT repeat domain-containing protein [Polyangiales bacterium]
MAVRSVRSESRRELWFWRVTTGAALSVCAFLPFQGTQARVEEREATTAAAYEARESHRSSSRSTSSGSARVRMLLASLERSSSTSNRCMVIDRLSRLPELDDLAVSQLARFTEEGQPLELRRCTGWALGNVLHPAAFAPLKALAEGDNTMLAETGLIALASHPDRASQKAAIELSAKRSRAMRVSVACTLADSGASEAVSLLAELLRDGNGYDRERLLMSLGRSGDPRAVGVLQGYLRQGNRQTQQSAIYALGEVGGAAATETLLSLLHDRPELAQMAVGALARTGSPEARDALLELAEKNADYGTGLQALQALSDLDGPGVQELMVRALDGTPGAQNVAIEYFVNHPQDDVFAKLESLARAGSPQTSSQSLQALARMGGDQALDVIESVATSGGNLAPMALQMLNQDSADPQRARRIALAQVEKGNASGLEILAQDDSPEARAALMALAQASESGVASRALWALAQRNDPEARKLTEALATSGDPQKRASAMWALAQSGDPAVVGTLRKSLSDSDDTVRREAVQALGQLPGAESEAALLRATRDRSPDVVGAAANALASLGTPGAIERLEEIARTPATASSGMLGLLSSAPARAQSLAEALIASQDVESRRAALMATTQLSSDVGSRILVRALADRDPDFVREAIETAAAGVRSEEVRASLRVLGESDLPAELKARAAELAEAGPGGYFLEPRRHHIY